MGGALLAAYFILNKISFKDENKTPFELWKGKTSRLNYLKESKLAIKAIVLFTYKELDIIIKNFLLYTRLYKSGFL